MATAVNFNGNNTKGVVLEGLENSPSKLQFHDRKFWGVSGVSRIYGNQAGREITVPVLIYDATDFDTAAKLSDYIDTTLNRDRAGTNGGLLITSEAAHSSFPDCTFEGAMLVDGPKKDTAGTLGGGYWAIVLMHFTQLS
jgi:hypothetical protein